MLKILMATTYYRMVEVGQQTLLYEGQLII